jgi:hypothetical protein
MRDRSFRALLGRLTDVAVLAAFLALAAFAYGAFFIGAGRMMASPVPEFANFYQPGQNPWTNAAPPPPQERLTVATRHRIR